MLSQIRPLAPPVNRNLYRLPVGVHTSADPKMLADGRMCEPEEVGENQIRILY